MKWAKVMLAQRCKVMIVEDAVENQVFFEEVLGAEYDLSIADSGEMCLEKLSLDRPDLILLDVGLPGMSGYEACRELKLNSETRDIPVIFVSAGGSSEERLAGYEAGADEYVIKPFAIDDLLYKVEDSLRAKQEEDFLKQTIAEAKQIAQQALASSNELAALNLFMQQSANSMSYEELADNVLRAANSFKLKCGLAVHASVASYLFGFEAGSKESQMLENSKGGQRIDHIEGKSVINARYCSLLVLNMPRREDSGSVRLLNHLVAIVDAASARIESLQYMLDKQAQRTSTIRQLLRSNEARLTHIRAQLTENKTASRKITTNLRLKIEQQLVMMELEDDKELAILQALNESVQELTNLSDVSGPIEASFQMANDTLNRLLD